jgi:hypothetical protein
MKPCSLAVVALTAYSLFAGREHLRPGNCLAEETPDLNLECVRQFRKGGQANTFP